MSTVDDVLRGLAVDIGARPVGTAANQAATTFLGRRAEKLGYAIEEIEFECGRWEEGESWIQLGSHRIPIQPSPFSAPVKGRFPVRDASTPAGLFDMEIEGCILLLRGELSALPYMPKDFPFYYPDEHKRIIDLLESRKPAAVVGLTGRHPGCGMDPFPLFEDGAFSIPSAYLSTAAFEAGAGTPGQPDTGLSASARGPAAEGRTAAASAEILIDSAKYPATGRQLIFSNGDLSKSMPANGAEFQKTIVVCAHMDTKYGTPGALDNAAGVATMFGVMERLARKKLAIRVEFVPFNSEEYYGADGELLYLRSRKPDPSTIRLAVNIDGLGHVASCNAFSFYNLEGESSDSSQKLAEKSAEAAETSAEAAETSAEAAETSAEAAETSAEAAETSAEAVKKSAEPSPNPAARVAGGARSIPGPQWYEGDHSVFLQAGIPCAAITSSDIFETALPLTHTDRDTVDHVDVALLEEAADIVSKIVLDFAADSGCA